MDEARLLAQKGAGTGTFVVAQSQSKGRGRRGRTWISQPHQGLWLTCILKPHQPCAPLHSYSLVAGMSVCKTLQHMGVIQARIKWPNDIWIAQRKLAGILIEAEQTQEHTTLLVGIGINIAPFEKVTLPEELNTTYTGLLEHLPPHHTLEQTHTSLLASLTQQMHTDYEHWLQHGLQECLVLWPSLDAMQHARVSAQIGVESIEGEACGIDPQGRLMITTSQGVRYVESGEITRLRHV